MTRKTYEALSAPFRNHPQALKFLSLGNKLLTLSCYALYPALLLWAFWTRDSRFWRLLLVPGLSFAAVSVFRKLYNSPRPYETLDIHPLIPRDKTGESFPSRHVFSVFVIAMSWGTVSAPMGWVLGLVGVLLAATRVVGGIHYPRDVAVGAGIGILSGLIGFYLV